MKSLTSLLTDALSRLPPGPIWIGFSAGLDSTVLLHVLAQIPAARTRGLTALHVHHGLQVQATAWAEQARAFAEHLGVDFQCARVSVNTIAQEGVEAAARRARRAAFAEHVPTPGILTLAHHRDDQVETVLLRLVHGAGQEGLAAMRPLRPLRRDDPRWLWRPLLDVPRSVLQDHARDHGLAFVEDPTNTRPEFIRSRLRMTVLPVLREHFPEAEAGIAASARRLQDEADALDQVARAELLSHLDPQDHSLACAPLRHLPPALVRRLLGFWLDQCGLPRPPAGIWPRLHAELLDARIDATPELRWHGARLRRHRDRLYADTGANDPDIVWHLTWNGISPLALPNGLGTLAFEPALETPRNFLVRPRRGGETLQLRGQHRQVKKLLQAAAIPPWKRRCLPLLFGPDGELLAIVGHHHSDAFARWLQQHQTRLCLHPSA